MPKKAYVVKERRRIKGYQGSEEQRDRERELPVHVDSAAQLLERHAGDNPVAMSKRVALVRRCLSQVKPDYITVIGLDPITKTAGGIIIPGQAQDRPTRGVIAVMGDEVTKHRPNWKPGVHVIYPWHAGTFLPLANWNVREMKWTEACWEVNDSTTKEVDELIGRVL